MNTKPEELAGVNRLILLGAAAKIVHTLHEWNVLDIPILVLDDGATSVYHHQNKALERILLHLGTRNSQSFYENILHGLTPEEALEMARASQ